MEVQAVAKSIRVSPRKMRLVADAVRNLSINDALHVLSAAQKRAALPIAKTLNSAIANAVNNAKLEKSSLVIDSIQISEGQALKRFHPSTRGRIHPYKKRSSTVRIVLQSVSVPVVAKPVASGVEEKKNSASVKTKADKGGKK